MLERKRDVGEVPHTTGILVKEVADTWDVPDDLTRKIHGVRLYAPSLRSVDLVSPGYYFLATDTPRLMRWLATEAEDAGATILTDTDYRGARWDRGRFWLEGADLSCQLLVGADGAQSRIAREFGLGQNQKFLVGMEAEYEGVSGVDLDRLHVFLDSELARGYIGWVVPSVGITQIGLACRPPARPNVDLFVRRLHEVFDFRFAKIVDRRGGLIPVGGPVHPLGRDGVLLVGDSAGLVSPLTAGGIHTALHFGRRAGQAISDHLLDGGPQPAQVLSDEVPSFLFKRLLRRTLDMPLPHRLYDHVLASPIFQSFARAIFFHNRGLLSRAAWRELAATRP